MKSPHPALVALVGVAMILVALTSASTCVVPTWPSSLGENPIATAHGKVLLVALVKGYCGYCIHQAENLELLKTHLARHGFGDIEMLLVNGGEPPSRENIHVIENAVNLTVLQDTEDHVMYNSVFQGEKDDFIVYNRCGQRAFFIPHPYSYIGHQVVERVLRATHRGHDRCPCQLDQTANNPARGADNSNVNTEGVADGNDDDPHDRMVGDQPRGPSYDVVRGDNPTSSVQAENDASQQTESMQRNLRCPPGDTHCEAIRDSIPYLEMQDPSELDDPLFEPLQAGHRQGLRGRGHGRRRLGLRGRGRGHHHSQRPRFHQSPEGSENDRQQQFNMYLQSLRESMEGRWPSFHPTMDQGRGNPMGEHLANPWNRMRQHRGYPWDPMGQGGPMEQDLSSAMEEYLNGHPMGQEMGSLTEPHFGGHREGHPGHRMEGHLGHRMEGHFGHRMEGHFGHRMEGHFGSGIERQPRVFDDPTMERRRPVFHRRMRPRQNLFRPRQPVL